MKLGGVGDRAKHVALRVGKNVALAGLDLFPASEPHGPPLSVAFTLWLSITPPSAPPPGQPEAAPI